MAPLPGELSAVRLTERSSPAAYQVSVCRRTEQLPLTVTVQSIGELGFREQGTGIAAAAYSVGGPMCRLLDTETKRTALQAAYRRF